MVPPTYRKNLSSVADTSYSWASSALSFSGKTLWVVSTSALLLGVPWAMAFSEEQQVQEMEREMRMQQSANEVSDNAYTREGRGGLTGFAVVDTRCGCWAGGRETCVVRCGWPLVSCCYVYSGAGKCSRRLCIIFSAQATDLARQKSDVMMSVRAVLVP